MSDYSEDMGRLSEIHVIPYSHHDYSWTNSRHWHILRYIRCYEEVLDIMRENKEFTWMIDNVLHCLAPFVKYRPGRVDELAERVREGRIAVANGGYSLARPNYVGDESFIRNMVEGKRYFKGLFGIPAIDFFYTPDVSCGHSQVPQMISLGGHKYYRFFRPEETLYRKGIPRQFKWKGLDGTEVLVSRGSYGGFYSGCGYLDEKDYEKQWDEVKSEFYEKELKIKFDMPLPSGIVWQSCGCDDCRPLHDIGDEPVNLFRFVEEWNKRENVRMFFATPGEHFKKLEAKELPVHEGVLDACDVSLNAPNKGNHSMWRMRYELDRSIVKCESLASFASLLGTEYPAQKIGSLWKSMFDITGHAIEYALKEDFDCLYSAASAAKYESARLAKDVCEDIAGKLAVKDGEQYTVFNTLNWERNEKLKLHIAGALGVSGFDLRDACGNDVDFQVTDIYRGDNIYAGTEFNELDIIADVRIPAMGYTTLETVWNGHPFPVKAVSGTEMHGKETETGTGTGEIHSSDETTVIDNGVIRAAFRRGALSEIKELDTGRLVRPDDGMGSVNRIRFVQTEETHSWLSEWETIREYGFAPEKWGLIEKGPLRWIYRICGKIGNSTFRQDISICRGERSLGFDLEIDSCEGRGYFIADFPADAAARVYADIPFGVEERKQEQEVYGTDTSNGYVDGRYERRWPGQFFARSWALFETGGAQVAIISENCSIYYNKEAGKKGISLLLNLCIPLDGNNGHWDNKVSPFIEGKGKNNYRYHFYIRGQNEGYSDIARFSREKAHPAEVVRRIGCFSINGSSEGMELQKSFISTDRDNVIISAFYMDYGGYVLRLSEMDGAGTRVTLAAGFDFTGVELIDFMGDAIKGIPYTADAGNRTVVMDVKPWQIVNVLFR